MRLRHAHSYNPTSMISTQPQRLNELQNPRLLQFPGGQTKTTVEMPVQNLRSSTVSSEKHFANGVVHLLYLMTQVVHSRSCQFSCTMEGRLGACAHLVLIIPLQHADEGRNGAGRDGLSMVVYMPQDQAGQQGSS